MEREDSSTLTAIQIKAGLSYWQFVSHHFIGSNELELLGAVRITEERALDLEGFKAGINSVSDCVTLVDFEEAHTRHGIWSEEFEVGMVVVEAKALDIISETRTLEFHVHFPVRVLHWLELNLYLSNYVFGMTNGLHFSSEH